MRGEVWPTMQRGDVWWASFPPGKRHPVVLLSWDAHGTWRDQVTVAAVTSTIRGLDAEVELGPDDGMPRRCVANLDSLATLNRSKLYEWICTLSDGRIAEIERAIHLALGIALPCQVAG